MGEGERCELLFSHRERERAPSKISKKEKKSRTRVVFPRDLDQSEARKSSSRLPFSRRLDWRRGDRPILRTAAGRRERRRSSRHLRRARRIFLSASFHFSLLFFFRRRQKESNRRKEKSKKRKRKANPLPRARCPASPAAANPRPSASPRACPTATRAMRGEGERQAKDGRIIRQRRKRTNERRRRRRRQYLKENPHPSTPFSIRLPGSSRSPFPWRGINTICSSQPSTRFGECA